MWIATPSPWWTLTTDFLPVSRRTRTKKLTKSKAREDARHHQNYLTTKTPYKETAMGERVAMPRALTYQDLTVVAVIRQYNCCIMARKLRLVENDFCILCNFNELRVVKIPHISTSALYT
jgi:hypothetical protein